MTKKNYIKLLPILLLITTVMLFFINTNQPQQTLNSKSIDITSIDSDKNIDLINSQSVVLEDLKPSYKLIIDNRLTFYLCSMDELRQTLTLVLEDHLETTSYYNISITEEIDALLSLQINSSTELLSPIKTATVIIDKDVPIVNNILDSNQSIDVIKPISNIIAINFLQQVVIEEVLIDKSKISTPSEVAEFLLKLNIEAQSYIVESGDSPSTIAYNNNMNLQDLYDLNSGLEDDPSRLQIGQELIVEKLEPELSIIITSEVSHTAPLLKSTVYKNDDTIYEGLEVIDEVGEDGVQKVTALVRESNEEEINRIIISETTLTSSENEVILVGTKPIPVTGAVGFYIEPLTSYRLTSSFGPRWGGSHDGIDMATPLNTSVYASNGGVVTMSGWYGGYGYMIEIDHGNNEKTRYAHNNTLLVNIGDQVGQGQHIANSGSTGNSTGPHLHFELILNGFNVDPFKYFIY